MAARQTPVSELAAAVRAWEACGRNTVRAADALKVNRSTFQSRLREAQRRGVSATSIDAPEAPVPHVQAPDEVSLLREQVVELKASLRAAKASTIDDDYVRSKIIGLTRANVEVPEWVLRKSAADQTPGTPTLFLSDWHWGEVVDAGQINNVNAYNLTVARARAKSVIERTITLLREHVVQPNYPGIVVALGGDMVSGDIHDELSETNEVPIMPAVIDLWGVLTWALNRMADEFGRVFVPCVTGNHGRNTKKPRAKGRNHTNFDWLLYNLLAKRFEDDERITFLIPHGSDAHWVLHGHRYCLTHGDQFRGGDGMIGALGPIARGDHKKRSRNMQIDMGYDTLLMGHWHQLMMLSRFIVNGSLKGYDEYAAANNFGYEMPQQALWLTHPKHGITFQMPVHLEHRQEHEREWLTWVR